MRECLMLGGGGAGCHCEGAECPKQALTLAEGMREGVLHAPYQHRADLARGAQAVHLWNAAVKLPHSTRCRRRLLRHAGAMQRIAPARRLAMTMGAGLCSALPLLRACQLQICYYTRV